MTHLVDEEGHHFDVRDQHRLWTVHEGDLQGCRIYIPSQCRLGRSGCAASEAYISWAHRRAQREVDDLVVERSTIESYNTELAGR